MTEHEDATIEGRVRTALHEVAHSVALHPDAPMLTDEVATLTRSTALSRRRTYLVVASTLVVAAAAAVVAVTVTRDDASSSRVKIAPGQQATGTTSGMPATTAPEPTTVTTTETPESFTETGSANQAFINAIVDLAPTGFSVHSSDTSTADSGHHFAEVILTDVHARVVRASIFDGDEAQNPYSPMPESGVPGIYIQAAGPVWNSCTTRLPQHRILIFSAGASARGAGQPPMTVAEVVQACAHLQASDFPTSNAPAKG